MNIKSTPKSFTIEAIKAGHVQPIMLIHNWQFWCMVVICTPFWLIHRFIWPGKKYFIEEILNNELQKKDT